MFRQIKYWGLIKSNKENKDTHPKFEGAGNMLKDFWGNDALDYGIREELETKYTDKLFVTVSDKPFGDPYVLFVCNEDERDNAEKFLEAYHEKMKKKGIRAFGSGISLGANLLAARLENFVGGVEL
jgi:hypothetical protein